MTINRIPKWNDKTGFAGTENESSFTNIKVWQSK
jgi:hypothetical protein